MWWYNDEDSISQMLALPLSLNLEVAEGKVVPIIKAGTQLPAEWAEEICTGSSRFDDIKLQLLVGESGEVSKNTRIGWAKVSAIPPGPETSAVVRIVIRVDTSGQIIVEAQTGGLTLPVKNRLKAPSQYLSAKALTKIRARSIRQ